MLEVGALEARNTLGSLLDRVQNGEEIVITRHGRPAARLIPYSRGTDRAAANAAAERSRARAARLKAGCFRWETYKLERDWGRP